jgi:hypothetical protein
VVGNFGRSKIFRGQIRPQICEVGEIENFGGREARKFGKWEGLEVLEARGNRQHPLTGKKCISAVSFRLHQLLCR